MIINHEHKYPVIEPTSISWKVSEIFFLSLGFTFEALESCATTISGITRDMETMGDCITTGDGLKRGGQGLVFE